MGRRVTRNEQGSAVAEYVMVLLLALSAIMGVVQLGFALHIRNTLISFASEGAREGARIGSSPAQGAERTRELIIATMSPPYAANVKPRLGRAAGVQVVVVEVTVPLPLLGPFGPSKSMTVTGRAFLEGQ